MLEQVGNPFGVLDVGLPTWDRFDVLGIDHHHLDIALEDIEDGSPEHTRTFHSYLATLLLGEPLAEPDEIWGHRAKGLTFFAALPIGRRSDKASPNGFLVD